MEPITIEELHNLLLDIAKEMHDILVRHDIPYYMLGGSQLGAVRHQGIIPWDDDMDFGVPRDFFQNAVDVLSRELPPRYKLRTTFDSPRILGDLCKIEDTATLIQETTWKSHLKDEMGVFIDLFPLDYSDGKYDLFSRDRVIGFLVGLQKYRFCSLKPRPFGKKIVAAIIKIVLLGVNRPFFTMFIRRFLLKKSGSHYANYYGAWMKKETVPISVFGVPTLYKVNDIMLYGVQDADKYLKSLYGDYMKLPSLEWRNAHLHLAGMFRKKL